MSERGRAVHLAANRRAHRGLPISKQAPRLKNQIVQTFGLFTEGRYVTLDTCFAMPWDSVLRPGVRQMIIITIAIIIIIIVIGQYGRWSRGS